MRLQFIAIISHSISVEAFSSIPGSQFNVFDLVDL